MLHYNTICFTAPQLVEDAASSPAAATAAAAASGSTTQSLLFVLFVCCYCFVLFCGACLLVVYFRQHNAVSSTRSESSYEEFTRLAETRLAQNTLN